MKASLKLHDHYEHLSISRIYNIEDQFCTARVTIYAMVENNTVDITDSEITFYINDKPCKYKGFKDLYVSLFSEFDFNNYYKSLCKSAEDAVLAHYARLKNIEKL